MSAARPLLISEIFGPTLQGEGPSLGRPCGFVRLGGCNLDCSWCDTSYTWDWSRFRPRDELSRVTVDGAISQIAAMRVDMVVVTGGEPMLQEDRLLPFLSAARERGWHVEVETNGTIAPSPAMVDLVGRFNVSPKLANSGIAVERRLIDNALRCFGATGRAVFKFVVEHESDVDEVDALVSRLGLHPVLLMPQATTADGVLAGLARLAGPAIERGYRLTPRLQVLLWGNQRGR